MKIKKKISNGYKTMIIKAKDQRVWKNATIISAKVVSKNKLVLAIIVFCIIVGFMNSNFWNWSNWLNIIELNTPTAVIAVGMTLVILTGGIDLSVGSVVAIVGAATFILNKSGISIPLAIMISILLGSAVGLLQGLFVGYLKLAPFIITLAGMLIFRGIAIVILEEHTINKIGDAHLLAFSEQEKFLGLSIQTWILILISIILLVVLKFTIFGRNVYAVGGNRKASLLSGIKVKMLEMNQYFILSFLTSIAAIMRISNTQSASPNLGVGMELEVIAMVVLGGTSLSGGQGGIIKTMIGWLILSVLYNALIIIGYSDSWQKIFSGIIIVIAVYLDKNKINIKKIIKNIKLIKTKYKNNKNKLKAKE